jgi:hypothetical protein
MREYWRHRRIGLDHAADTIIAVLPALNATVDRPDRDRFDRRPALLPYSTSDLEMQADHAPPLNLGRTISASQHCKAQQVSKQLSERPQGSEPRVDPSKFLRREFARDR